MRVDVDMDGNELSPSSISVVVSKQLQSLQSCSLTGFFFGIEVSQMKVLPIVHDARTPAAIGVLTNAPNPTAAVRPFAVLLILLSGRKPQMRWVDAQWLMASVINLHSLGDFPVGHDVRDSMDPASSHARQGDNAVSTAGAAQPHPAPRRIGLIHHCPEPLLGGAAQCAANAPGHQSSSPTSGVLRSATPGFAAKA